MQQASEIPLWLSAPILVLVGVVITGIVQFLTQKWRNRVEHRQTAVSETEAQTHQFQAIIDGFTQSLAAVNSRATTAEAEAKAARTEASSAQVEGRRANDRAALLEGRVDQLEDERTKMINHIIDLEALIPSPPGPPPRPSWMR